MGGVEWRNQGQWVVCAPIRRERIGQVAPSLRVGVPEQEVEHVLGVHEVLPQTLEDVQDAQAARPDGPVADEAVDHLLRLRRRARNVLHIHTQSHRLGLGKRMNI